MPSYAVLNAMPPEAFLNPALFVTGWDSLPANIASAPAARARGLKLKADGCNSIHITAGGVWGAKGPNFYIESYEGIGYHANTAALLEGFLASGLPIIVYRRDKPPVTINRSENGHADKTAQGHS